MKKIFLTSMYSFLGIVLFSPLYVSAVTLDVNGETVDVQATEETKQQWQDKKEEVQKNAQEKKEEVQKKVRDKQCDMLISRKEVSLNRIENKTKTAQTRMTARESSYDQRVVSSDQRYEARKNSSQQARETLYQELEEMAITQDQKDAVATFETTIEASSDKKYIAIDSARKEYREAQEEAISEKNDAMMAPYTTYYTSVEKAMNSATSSCTGGTEMTSVRTKLRTDLNDARAMFQQDMTEQRSSFRGDLTSAQNEYKEAINKANLTYRSEVSQALSDLEEVLGDISSITITIDF
jgi:hypothetical protein